MQQFLILLVLVVLGWLSQFEARFGWYPEYLYVFPLTFRERTLFQNCSLNLQYDPAIVRRDKHVFPGSQSRRRTINLYKK